MTSSADRNCTYLISTEKSSSVLQEDICKDLESQDIQIKIKYVGYILMINVFTGYEKLNIENNFRALKNSIIALLAGENMPRVLMTVIRLKIRHLLKSAIPIETKFLNFTDSASPTMTTQ